MHWSLDNDGLHVLWRETGGNETEAVRSIEDVAGRLGDAVQDRLGGLVAIEVESAGFRVDLGVPHSHLRGTRTPERQSDDNAD